MENSVENSENRVKKVVNVTPISIDKVYTGDFQKEGTKSAQLRQVVTTKAFYPSKQVTSNLQDNPFNVTEFGFTEQEFENVENRVCWIDVPESVSKDDVLAKLPVDGTLFRMMSNRPILTNNQLYSIEIGQKTTDDYANSQIVRFGKGHENEGQIVKDANGKPQYRAIFYSNEAKKDVDRRTEIANDFYASVQISAEMSGAQVMEGQTL
jgi:hypothetical protein